VDLLRMFEEDEETAAVVVVGEVGGDQEERAAGFIAGTMTKPVVAYVAGRTSPKGVRMGHAGAIVSGAATGSAESKAEALASAGVRMARRPSEVVRLVREALYDREAPAIPAGYRAAVRIEPDLCKGTEDCRICLHICPEEVLGTSPRISARGVHPAAVSHPEACTGCDLCMLYCPDLAVTVDHPKELARA
jgi:NAD-dependent dihydropyrimidine dehydrogenase PreA subunit